MIENWVLNASPDEILEHVEEFYLAQRIEEVEDEPSYPPEDREKGILSVRLYLQHPAPLNG